jgi:translation initiation factor 1
VRRERAGRRGKTVTVAGPLFLAPPAARELLRTLKRECGSGGTLKGDRSAAGATAWAVEIQGDHLERMLDRLGDLGYRVRREGG